MAPPFVEYFEVAFDVLYLITVFTIGIYMLCQPTKTTEYIWYAVMTLILGFGDSFHLIPRIIGLCQHNLDQWTKYLDYGKFVTSITMTIFYIIMYETLKYRYNIHELSVYDIIFYLFGASRLVSLFMPMNEWFTGKQNLTIHYIRNIVFTIQGITIIIFSCQQAILHNDESFKYVWLAITLSFVCYAIVVYLPQYKFLGAFMLPKTCAYIWLIVIFMLDINHPHSD